MQIAVLAQYDFRVWLNVSSFFAEAFGVVSMAEPQQVQVSYRNHYVTPGDNVEPDPFTREHKLNTHTVVCAMKLSGNIFLIAHMAHQMCPSLLANCITTVVAKTLPAPRMVIRLIWRPLSDGCMEATVVVNRLLTMLEITHPSYNEQYDAQSDYWLTHGPNTKADEILCSVCGDLAFDVDYNPFREREDMCRRCLPMDVCERCCVHISAGDTRKERVCVRCLKRNEIDTLNEDEQKWVSYNFVSWDDDDDPDVPRRCVVPRLYQRNILLM